MNLSDEEFLSLSGQMSDRDVMRIVGILKMSLPQGKPMSGFARMSLRSSRRACSENSLKPSDVNILTS